MTRASSPVARPEKERALVGEEHPDRRGVPPKAISSRPSRSSGIASSRTSTLEVPAGSTASGMEEPARLQATSEIGAIAAASRHHVDAAGEKLLDDLSGVARPLCRSVHQLESDRTHAIDQGRHLRSTVSLSRGRVVDEKTSLHARGREARGRGQERAASRIYGCHETFTLHPRAFRTELSPC